MKKILLTLLAVVLTVGMLSTVGFAGYQYGFRQGTLLASKSDSNAVAPGFNFNPHNMPMHNFGSGNGLDRGYGPGNFHMRGHGGMGFSFFSPLMFLIRIVFWALVIWAIYTLINRSGWKLTKEQPAPVDRESIATEPPGENKEA